MARAARAKVTAWEGGDSCLLAKATESGSSTRVREADVCSTTSDQRVSGRRYEKKKKKKKKDNPSIDSPVASVAGPDYSTPPTRRAALTTQPASSRPRGGT